MKAGGASELQGMGAPGPGGAALGCGQPRMLTAPPNEERRHRQDVLGVHLAWPPSGDLASSQLSSVPPVTQPRNFLEWRSCKLGLLMGHGWLPLEQRRSNQIT